MVFFHSPPALKTTVWRAPFDKVKTYCQAGDIFYPPTTTNDISEPKKGGSEYAALHIRYGFIFGDILYFLFSKNK